ncbi:MAG TPA: hypothetical protein EYQ54_15745 [Myxococcales bacterium]|nr:hypothetical protein [Myxococcales bacterium]
MRGWATSDDASSAQPWALRGSEGRGRPWRRRANFLALVFALVFVLVFVLALVGVPGAAADMGLPLGSGMAGPYRVDLVAFPAPLRVGDAVFSVLIRERESGAVRTDLDVRVEVGAEGDARVDMGVEGDGGMPETSVGRAEKGRHPGFYSIQVRLAQAGRGGVAIAIKPQVGESSAAEARLNFLFDTLPAPKPWRQHAGAIAFPFGLIALFVWHQRRRAAGRPAGRAKRH